MPVASDIALVRAENPSPLTLTGTNTWVVGRDPCWVIDPGPLLDAHQAAVVAEVARRGGAGGIAVTHDHHDHAEGVHALRDALGATVPVAAARLPADVALGDGDEFGPLRAVATPGHAVDHLAFVCGGAVFTGDTVLGHGTAFLYPTPGALREYLAGLEALRRLDPVAFFPGHGEIIDDPHGKLDEYVAHRLDREQRLLAGLAAGAVTVEAMLDAAWDDVPAALRPVAAITLAAHLDKLEEEGRLPAGVDRPDLPWL